MCHRGSSGLHWVERAPSGELRDPSGWRLNEEDEERLHQVGGSMRKVRKGSIEQEAR